MTDQTLPVSAAQQALTPTPPETALAPDPALVQRIRQEVRLADRAAVTSYGEGAQRGVAAFADQVLRDTMAKDSGSTGELLTSLIGKVSGLDPGNLGKAGLLDRVFGSAKKRLFRFKEQFSSVATQVDRIALELERQGDNLKRDIAMLDGLFDRNLVQLRELEAYIVAGTEIVTEARTKDLPALQAKAGGAAADGVEGQLVAQQVSDLTQSVERLERKVHDLKLSRMISLQTMPQIRLVQNGNSALVEKLQSSLTATIPTWKNGMTIALALQRQDAALQLQRQVSETTNAMLRRNAEQLKTGMVGIEKEAQRGIVDIETLTHVNRQFVDTIKDVLAAQRDGHAKRQVAETELKRIEAELKQTLLQGPT